MELREKRKTVNQLFPPTSSIFSKMDYNFQIITKDKLDLIFLLSEGERYVNAIVDYYTVDGEISSTAMQSLADLTLAYYKERWDRLIEIYSIEYDPIHNFSDNLQEDITDAEDTETNNTGTQQNSGSRQNTGTQGFSGTTNNTGTQVNSGTDSGTDNDLIYGLNSTTSVGANDNIRSGSHENTRTDNLSESQSNTRTDNLTRTDSSTRTDNLKETFDKDYTRARTVTRTGNIGNITTQQMLLEEIELWKWNFVWEVIADVKDFLTLRLYKNEMR